MKTKGLPAIIMLAAGFVTCISLMIQGADFGTFVVTLFWALFWFLIVGFIVKIVIDKVFFDFDSPIEDDDSMGFDEFADMEEYEMEEEEYEGE